MVNMNITLEDWQQEALAEMARNRGVAAETIARSLLADQIVQQIHTSFDELMYSTAPNRFPSDVSSDAIEFRLRKLFDE